MSLKRPNWILIPLPTLQTVRTKIDEMTREINSNKLSLEDQKQTMRDLEAKVKAESEKVGDGKIVFFGRVSVSSGFLFLTK